MGGTVSHEFMVPAASGEDIILTCPQCKASRAFKEEGQAGCAKCGARMDKVNAIEVGHIFQLGTKYSGILTANFLDADGKLKPIIMGCYGIGVSRLIAAIIEQNHDDNGIIWPGEVSPCQVVILTLDITEARIMDEARRIYEDLSGSGVSALLDDRDERAGVKFKDADLLGISLQIIIGKDTLKNNTVELKVRRGGEKLVGSRDAVLSKVREIARV